MVLPPTPPEKVLVTGASGFIGRTLLARLRELGSEARGVDLRADPTAGVVAGDLTRPGPWTTEAQGCDVVVHTAAIVSQRADPAGFWEANVVAVRRALDAARAGGAKRFVQLSSVVVFGNDFPDGVDESWPVRPVGVPYTDTKIASEQVALMAHAAGELEATVVRPGDVYGPGSRPWTILPVEMLRARRLVLPARGRGVFSPVYVDDLVDGIVRAAVAPAAAGRVLTLSGGVGVSTGDFFGRYAAMLGRRGVPSLPTAVASALGAAVDRACRVARIDGNEVNANSAAYLARRGTYSIARARELAGWEPQVDLDEGMRRSEAWLRATGRL